MAGLFSVVVSKTSVLDVLSSRLAVSRTRQPNEKKIDLQSVDFFVTIIVVVSEWVVSVLASQSSDDY